MANINDAMRKFYTAQAFDKAASKSFYETATFEGQAYRTYWSGTVAGSSTKEFYFVCPDKNVYLASRELTSLSDSMDYEVWASPTASVLGTPITIYSTNNTIADTPESLFYEDPTFTDNGTLIDEVFLSTTSGLGTIGSGDVSGDFATRVLAPNNTFRLVLRNNNASAQRTLLNLRFVEFASG